MGDINFIHSDKYSKAIELSKKFVAKVTARPILLFVEHRKDGSIFATDSSKALIVENVHGFDQDYLINPNTLEFATGKFPDTSQLRNHNYKHVITLDREQIKVWLQMHRSMNQMFKMLKSKRHKIVNVTIDEKKRINFNIRHHENELDYRLPTTEISGSMETISYDNERMRDALEVHEKLESEKVFIKFTGILSPFVLTNDEDVSVYVSPIRTY
jgi:hypothetical protein